MKQLPPEYVTAFKALQNPMQFQIRLTLEGRVLTPQEKFAIKLTAKILEERNDNAVLPGAGRENPAPTRPKVRRARQKIRKGTA